MMRRAMMTPLLGLLAAGCGSFVSSGDVGGRPVRLDGTGVAWMDTTTYEADQGEVVRTERPSDETTLHLLFSSVVFDPGVDIRSLPVAERLQLMYEMSRGDSLSMAIRRGDRVDEGDTLRYDNTDPEIPESGPYLASASLQLGEEPLSRESEYPDRIEWAGSGLRVTLTLNQTEPRIQGEADIEVFAREQEAELAGVAEGKVELRFDVEVLPERLAECNFDPAGAGGIVDPCDTLELGE